MGYMTLTHAPLCNLTTITTAMITSPTLERAIERRGTITTDSDPSLHWSGAIEENDYKQPSLTLP